MGCVSIQLIDTGQITEFTQQEKLGEGVFAVVDLVTDNKGNKFALKTVHIDPQKGENRREQFLACINEAKALKKVGLLEGYKFNKAKSAVYLLLPYFPGRGVGETITRSLSLQKEAGSESLKLPITFEQLKQLGFRELRKLHRRGFVHGDAHVDNFIYIDALKRLQLIDLGSAYPSSVLSNIFDAHAFVLDMIDFEDETFKRDIDPGNPFLFFNKKLQGWLELPKLYANEMLEYISQNKIEAAQNCLIYGALTLAAVYGILPIAAAQMIGFQLLRSIVLHELACTFKAWSFAQTQLYHGRRQHGMESHADDARYMANVYEALAGLFMALNLCYNFDFSALHSVGTSVPTLFYALSTTSQNFWTKAAKNIPFKDLLSVTIMYFSFSDLYKYVMAKANQHMLTEDIIDEETKKQFYPAGGIYNLFRSVRYPRSLSLRRSYIFPEPSEVADEVVSTPSLST